MISTTVQVRNLGVVKQLITYVKSLDKDPEFVKEAVKKISSDVKSEINLHWKYHGVNHDKDEGLSKSIYWVVRSKNRGIVTTANPIAVFVERGTKAHLLANGKPVMVKSIVRGSGLQEWKMVVHKGSKPKQYFQKGLEVFYKHHLNKIVEKKLKKLR